MVDTWVDSQWSNVWWTNSWWGKNMSTRKELVDQWLGDICCNSHFYWVVTPKLVDKWVGLLVVGYIYQNDWLTPVVGRQSMDWYFLSRNGCWTEPKKRWIKLLLNDSAYTFDNSILTCESWFIEIFLLNVCLTIHVLIMLSHGSHQPTNCNDVNMAMVHWYHFLVNVIDWFITYRTNDI